jgi:hypothetical protein
MHFLKCTAGSKSLCSHKISEDMMTDLSVISSGLCAYVYVGDSGWYFVMLTNLWLPLLKIALDYQFAALQMIHRNNSVLFKTGLRNLVMCLRKVA